MSSDPIWSAGDIILEKYKILKFITSGIYAKIYLVQNLCTKEECILKFYSQGIINRQSLRDRQHLTERITNEIAQQKNLHHPHIVQLLDWTQTPFGYYLFMQKSGTRDLYDYLDRQMQRRRRLDEKQVREMFKQLLYAVEYMHQHNILHRDIKSENIFVEEIMDESGNIKVHCRLGDFDWSQQMNWTGHCPPPKNHPFAGTLQCMSPEALRGKSTTRASDIWGLGWVLYEMLTNGFSPWLCNPEKIVDVCTRNHNHYCDPVEHFLNDHMEQGKISQRPLARNTHSVRDLLNHLLHPDATMRFTMAQIWDHPWMICQGILPEPINDDSSEETGASPVPEAPLDLGEIRSEIRGTETIEPTSTTIKQRPTGTSTKQRPNGTSKSC